MPYKLVEVDGGWKVQDDSGKNYSEKPLPKQRAAAQMRALYANEPASKEIVRQFTVDQGVWKEHVKETGLTVYKDANGDYRWILFSSNAYRDIDREIISSKALEADVSRDGADFGPLRWWHVPGVDMGRCDWRTLSDSGRTLIESGTFYTKEIGEAMAKAAPNLQVSIGFLHPAGEPDSDGVYKNIRIFERSLLPAGRAANPFTRVFVKGDDMATKQEKLEELKKLGVDPEAILAQANQAEKELDAAGVAFKEGDGALPASEAEKAKMPPAMTGEDDEEDGIASEECKTPAKKEEAQPNMDAFTAMLKEVVSAAVSEALAPLVAQVQTVEATQKEAGAAASVIGAAVDVAVQKEADARGMQVKQLQGEIMKLQAQLKELTGEMPRAVWAGYRASQADETVINEATQKQLGAPAQDPFAVTFLNNLFKS